MSDIMRPIPYAQLLDRVLAEYQAEGSIFGVSKIVKTGVRHARPLFGGKIETPFGPAAGPNTQLAQNIVASYAAGARFFELKTVQKMDGRELAACVPKPCIASLDECYNCEWSTELTVEEAYAEYVKAFFLLRVIAAEFSLGSPDGFIFNMSVGYDLEGIKTEKIDRYIEGMKDASGTEIFKECLRVTREAALSGRLKHVTLSDLEAFPTQISASITESTLHGCPPDEIERIAAYLLEEKGLHTFVKCNPTLLGYTFARETLDALGFDYIAFDDHHFLEDLQWEDALPMFRRLTALSEKKQLSFGLKLTNTFPVDVKAGELPSEEMYMSGRSLFPLTIELCRRIAEEFSGKLQISYSGGADAENIEAIVDAGIWPVTMATTVLKPGGYQRFAQIAAFFEGQEAKGFEGIDAGKVRALQEKALDSAYYRKPVKPVPSAKMDEALPMLDCFTAPCRTNCPIGQDIPAYLRVMEEGRAKDALEIILKRNALPFITGTICPHTCGDRCMRNHYEDSVHIREVKLLAARTAHKELLAQTSPGSRAGGSGRKTAVIGAGPAGLSVAYFLSRAGEDVTVFEKEALPGGVPRYVIPSFRIGDDAIDADVALIEKSGAKIVTGREIGSIRELKEEGYTDIVVAIGAWAPGRKALQYGEAVDALEIMRDLKQDPEGTSLGENVVVIGGGNTAMDAARAAKRAKGTKNVKLVYRRTKRYMPADEEELMLAIEDGVEFAELLAPVGLQDGMLTCEVMELGAPDESGRRSPVSTGKTITLKADTVITAVGEQIDGKLYQDAGIETDAKGRPVTDASLRTSDPQVFAAGDARRGPATAVKGIADAQLIAAAILAEARAADPAETAEAEFGGCAGLNKADDPAPYLAKKGVLHVKAEEENPDRRCLGCATVCEVCTDVCPNRANVAINVPGLSMPQILHIDGMCNECGNCAVFCPYSGRPYKDKFTLFGSEEDFADSENSGFLPLDQAGKVRVRIAGRVQEVNVNDPASGLYEPLRKLILAVYGTYSYLLP